MTAATVPALLDSPALLQLVLGLALNLTFASVVIWGTYFRLYRNREYVFTYLLFNTITFFLCFLLRRVSVELGMSLALFGVFGILRYRTDQIRTRELTYLFIVIGIGLLNAIAVGAVSLAELLLTNLVIAGMTGALEHGFSRPRERTVPMLYDQLALLQPGNEELLLTDLRTRTGLAALRVEITRVDFLHDAAEIVVTARTATDERRGPSSSSSSHRSVP